MDYRDAALVLVGHGSTLNADSSAPTFQHAEILRQRGLFAEVHESFWKEEPNIRQTLRNVCSRRIFIVPNFISSGYFTERVIPREFGLAGTVTNTDEGREIYYCQPVGLHPVMTQTLLHRAREVVEKSGVPIENPRQTACLLICGHGTSLNDNSTKIIRQRVEEIHELGLYADCQMVLMEQKPFVKDWRAHTDCPDVIIVPYFISDGLHSFEDIPVLIGITENVRTQGVSNPHIENGRRLWYATAIGTEAMIADAILAQVENMSVYIPARSGSPEKDAHEDPPRDEWLGIQKIGQVEIYTTDTGYELRHIDDHSEVPDSLRLISTVPDWSAWRELIRDGCDGEFRPLKAAPNLQRGWRFPLGNSDDLHLALQYLYPSALANWRLACGKKLNATQYPKTAARQSGRYQIVHALGEEALEELTRDVCDAGCLKKRFWGPDAVSRTSVLGRAADRRELPLLCPEACNYFVGKAREKIKGEKENE